jgi:hypothetical protein
VLLLNIVGFIVVSTHFGSRGVPIEQITFGARTVWAAVLVVLLPLTFIILMGSAAVGGQALSTIVPQLLRSVFGKRPKPTEEEADSKVGTFRELFSEKPLAFVYAFLATFLPLISAQSVLALPHVFFGDLDYDPEASAWEFRFKYLSAVLIFGIVHYLIAKLQASMRKKAESQPRPKFATDPKTTATLNRLQKRSTVLIVAGFFMLWCIQFYLHMYPKMRSEFGGGRPKIVSMYFTESVLAHMKLGEPLTSVPNSELARKVRIIFETDEDYRISPAIEENPPVIYRVNKDDVTLVAISPEETAP